MPELICAIRKKIAVNPYPTKHLVCGNSDYTIKFDFDDDWADLRVKTARFIYDGHFADVVFEGDTVAVPVLQNTLSISVGVFAGDVKTSTPAFFAVMPSITSQNGVPAPPTEDVYNQIINLIEHSGVDPAVIGRMVEEYLAEHPVPVPPDLSDDVRELREAMNGKQDTIADLSDIRDGAEKGKTALQSFTETDPTVPDWAKQETKPEYSADEVGAVGRPEFSRVVSELKEKTGLAMPPVVSFVDDDAGAEAYTVLFPMMQEHNVPYTFAVPVGSVGDAEGKFCTWSQLQEMNSSSLVDFSCHCVHDDVMTEHTAEEMEAIYIQWKSEMNSHGLPSDVSTYMYNHGTYVQSTIDSVVKRYFNYGFTVTKGINVLPFDNYHMKRVGLFPSDGSFTIADAKAKVDELIEQGTGWLLFFTHCYYPYFDLGQLLELISYIRAKGVEIVGVEDIIARFKVFEHKEEEAEEQFEDLTFGTVGSKVIAKASSASAGKVITSTSANNHVTEGIPVTPGQTLLISGTAYSDYGKYTFLNASGNVVLCIWQEPNKSGSNAIFGAERIEVPAGAVSLIVSGNSGQKMPEVKRLKPHEQEVTMDAVKELIAPKLTEPAEMAVGQIFRIASFDENGHAVLECVDEPSGGVTDVQTNGTSIVTDGVANIPIANQNSFGLVKIFTNYGIRLTATNELAITKALLTDIEAGNDTYKPITTDRQHNSVFYGLAKVAGVDLAQRADASLGSYPEDAQIAIQQMLGILSVEGVEF